MKIYMILYAAAVGFLTSASSATAQEDPENPELLTGIYVEVYAAPGGCSANPPNSDGWLAVPGFPNRGAGCPGVTPADGLPYGSNITFSPQANRTYRIFGVSSTQSIGTITLTGTAPGVVLLLGRRISSPPFGPGSPLVETAAAGSIGSVSAPFASVYGRSKGTIGAVTAAAVFRLDATNFIGNLDITNSVTIVRGGTLSDIRSRAANIGTVVIENWDNGLPVQDYVGTITADVGDIVSVAVVGAKFRGNLLAEQGRINAVSGELGIGPVSGTPSTIRARNGVGTVFAPGINAEITANFGGGSGAISLVEANGTTANGFAGSLTAAAISGTPGQGIGVTGPLTATVNIVGNVSLPVTVSGVASAPFSIGGQVSQPILFNGGIGSGPVSIGTLAARLAMPSTPSGSSLTLGTLASGGRIDIAGNHSGSLLATGQFAGSLNIGGSLSGQVSVSTPVGLSGRVIVNAANTAPPATWEGEVSVGPVILAPSQTGLSRSPHYQQYASVLGGGTIGLVPFALHDESCSPSNIRAAQHHIEDPVLTPESFRATESGPASEVRLRFYGPIKKESTGNCVSLSKVNYITGMEGTLLDSMIITDVVDGHTLRVRSTGLSDFTPGLYRIRPVRDGNARLLCDLGASGPVVPVAAFTNGTFEGYDFAIGAGCPSPEVCCPTPFCFFGDFDQSHGGNSTDGDDTTAFFAAWDNANPVADVNLDGGVDGDDIIAFMCWWDHNACNLP